MHLCHAYDIRTDEKIFSDCEICILIKSARVFK